jgi:uncharacterized Zn-finger protein
MEIVERGNNEPGGDSNNCEVCSKYFDTNADLKKHRHIHEKMQKYKCILCQKTFSKKDHLQTHSAVHSGVKRYQ